MACDRIHAPSSSARRHAACRLAACKQATQELRLLVQPPEISSIKVYKSESAVQEEVTLDFDFVWNGVCACATVVGLAHCAILQSLLPCAKQRKGEMLGRGTLSRGRVNNPYPESPLRCAQDSHKNHIGVQTLKILLSTSQATRRRSCSSSRCRGSCSGRRCCPPPRSFIASCCVACYVPWVTGAWRQRQDESPKHAVLGPKASIDVRIPRLSSASCLETS